MTWFFLKQLSIFLKGAIFFYFLSFLSYSFFAFKRKYKYFPMSILGIGWLFNTALILNYWVIYDTIPTFTTHQILIFLAWSTILLYLVLEISIKFKLLGIIFSLVSFLLLFSAIHLLDFKAHPSIWIENLISSFEIFTASLLFLVFLFSILYLAFPETKELHGHWLDLINLNFNQYLNKLINFSLISLFISIISRSLWILNQKGHLWEFKLNTEMTLFFTVLYLFILHLRQLPKWSGKRIAWILVGGSLIIIFSIFIKRLYY